MKKLPAFITRIVTTITAALGQKPIGSQPSLPLIPSEKLLSMISSELHFFYYPENTRSTDFLASLVNEAKRRGLAQSETLKRAQTFLSGNTPGAETLSDLSENFLSLAQQRTSIREFTDKPIPESTLLKILECGIQAPSSCNRQPWRFLVITDYKQKMFAAKIRKLPFLEKAPALICVLINTSFYKGDDESYTGMMDAGAAIMNILHAAQHFAIGSCWINFGALEVSHNDASHFKEFFQLSPDLKPVSLVALGYTKHSVKKLDRESIDYYMVNSRNPEHDKTA